MQKLSQADISELVEEFGVDALTIILWEDRLDENHQSAPKSKTAFQVEADIRGQQVRDKRGAL